MRILITGGAGFIGSAFIKKIILEGHEAVSYDLNPSPIGETILGNILDQEAVNQAVKTCDKVFHFAAAADLNYCITHAQEAIDLNVRGVNTFAKACIRYEKPLNFASTCCVYGDTAEHPSNELSIPIPTEIYAVTKVAAEDILRKYAVKHNLSYNILRIGTTYGMGMRATLAIYWWITQARKGIPLTIHGTGEQTRCMVYIEDLVEAFYKLAIADYTNKTINITRPEEKSVLETASLINKLMDQPLENFEFVDDRPGQIMKEDIDIKQAIYLLNWIPKTSLEDGLIKTIPWVLANSPIY